MSVRRCHLALLGLVFVLAALFRLPDLGRVPAALHPDEAATAADALELPGRPALVFAHEGGGWVEGTYTWLAAPALAGARRGWLAPETAARLPAAGAGLALVVGVWFLGRRLGGQPLAGTAALLIAVQPWSWHLSHLALRGTLVPALLVWGLVLIDRTDRWAWAGSALLALAAATYPPARVVVPLVAAAWLVTARGAPSRRVAIFVPVAFVALALVPWTLGPQGGIRLEQVSVLEDGGLLTNGRRVGRGYVLHYTTRFLFSGASSRGFAPEGIGLLHLAVAPLLVVGLLSLGRRALRGEQRALRLVAWLLLFPVAAAFTVDVPNPMRAACGAPVLALTAGHGLVAVVRRCRRGARRPLVAVVVACVLAQGGLAAHAYRTSYVEDEAAFYYPGRREAVRLASELANEPGQVVITAPFLEAYLRLYAPALARARTEDTWTLGPGPGSGPRTEVWIGRPSEAGVDRADALDVRASGPGFVVGVRGR